MSTRLQITKRILKYSDVLEDSSKLIQQTVNNKTFKNKDY